MDTNNTAGQPILETESLSLGQEVSIRWTSCNRFFAAYGPITKINRKSIKVELPEPVASYPAGFEVTILIPGTDFNGAWLRA